MERQQRTLSHRLVFTSSFALCGAGHASGICHRDADSRRPDPFARSGEQEALVSFEREVRVSRAPDHALASRTLPPGSSGERCRSPDGKAPHLQWPPRPFLKLVLSNISPRCCSAVYRISIRIKQPRGVSALFFRSTSAGDFKRFAGKAAVSVTRVRVHALHSARSRRSLGARLPATATISRRVQRRAPSVAG